jgi:hypothetical protein
MKPETNQSFEGQLNRALKELPALPAPRTLLPRVLAEIERRAALPWYRRGWQSWPTPLRATALALLVAQLPVHCLLGWMVVRSDFMSQVGQVIGTVFSFLGAIATTTLTLARTAFASAAHLEPWQLAALLLVALAAAASCYGFGTLYYRLTIARR